MKKFNRLMREILFEREYKFVDIKPVYDFDTGGGWTQIYINPTPSELLKSSKEDAPETELEFADIYRKTDDDIEARGFVDEEGNLYIWNVFFMHLNVIKQIFEGDLIYSPTNSLKKFVDKDGNRIITVHIIGDDVYVGESEEIIDKQLKNYFEKAKAKNDYYNFLPRKVFS